MMPLGAPRHIAAHPDMMPHREAREEAETGGSHLLVACRLPFFDCVYRVGQHQDIQGEVVSNQDR